MENRLAPDVCVIGAGSGGLSVAAAVAAFGVSVVLIEKGEMGGDCLNYGCVPSKAMLAAAKHVRAIREAPEFGISPQEEPSVNRRAVADHIGRVIASIAPNDSQERFTSLGVTVIREHARFVDGRTVIAGDCHIRARRFVVATGSSPLVPPIEGLEETGYFTNENIFGETRRPGHLVIIGGGPIGMEMAQAHIRLGSAVTVLESMTALNKDDPELAGVVTEQLRAEGVDIREHAKVVEVRRRGKYGVSVIYEDEAGGGTVDGTDILVAVGRKANVEGLGLDSANVRHDEKGIRVDRRLRTSNVRVYAVGDVAGALQFTHVAGYHAGQVVRSLLFGFGGRVDQSAIPWVTFTDPELAHVGLTEQAARKKHRHINVLRWPYHENDRAQAERRTQGHIKIIATRRGRILGATVVGATAGEMIHLWTLALTKKMKLSDILGYVPPYPTYSEIGRRAAITHFAPMARKEWVRRIIAITRMFG